MHPRSKSVGAGLILAAALCLTASSVGRADLVVHWKLDGDAVDAAGGDHNATLVGGPQFVPARVGSAGLDVDGSNDYASVSYTLPDQGSIALWYETKPWYNYQTIFDNSVDANDWEMWIYNTGVLRSRINGGVGETSDDLDGEGGPDRWHHVAYTWDRTDGSSSAAKLYVNGELKHTDDIPTWTTPGSTFSIAGGNPGNTKGNGTFDDVRIYDHVLTANDVAVVSGNQQAPSTAPIVQWQFDGNTTDAAGADHNATVRGTGSYAPGRTGTAALDLDNSRTVTTGGNFVSLQRTLPDEGTIATWYFAEPWYNYQSVWDNSTNQDDWEAWIYSDGRLRSRIDGASGVTTYDLDNLGGPDHWYHVAYTWDKSAGTTDLYVNGKLRDSAAITNWIEPGSYFYLGGGNDGNRYADGMWDDTRIYNRALSADEVAAVSGNKLPTSAAPIVQWQLDGNTLDSAGTDHNLTITGPGTASYVPGRTGTQALDLGNSPSASTGGNRASLQHTLPDEGTIAMWYYAEPWYNYQSVWDNSADPNDWEAWVYSDGRLRSRIDGASGVTTYDLDALGGPNHWYHIAYTWDKGAGTTELYVNGQLRDSAAITNWIEPGSYFYLGGGSSGNTYGNGLWDDVRIYNRVLSANEVAAVSGNKLPTSVAPIVHWAFDGNGLDAAGLDHNATLHGSASFAPGPPLTGSPALDLDNSRTATTGGNYVSLQHTLPEQGSIAMWYYAEGPWYNYQTLFDNSVNPDDWEMWIYDNGVLRFRVDQGSGDVDFDLDELGGPDNWYHIALTWDKDSEARLYIDGVLRDTDAIANWIDPGSYFYLAGGNPGNRYGTGIWDDVRLYNRVLSANEVYVLAVPEPATLSLLGLGALALLRRRRR